MMVHASDNSNTQREFLESLARRLALGGIPSEELRSLLPRIEECGPESVLEAVDALVASGMELEAMKPAVSRLLNLLHRHLSQAPFEPKDPFFRLLAAENRAALGILEGLRAPLSMLLLEAAAESREDARIALASAVEELAGLELHYQRKEHVLFPYFEARHPRYRCLSLMWSIHDDVRRALRELPLLIKAEPLELGSLKALSGRLFFDIHTLIFREEKILYPAAANLLSPAELSGLFREARALGSGLLTAAALAAIDSEAEAWQASLEPVSEDLAGMNAAPMAGSARTVSPASHAIRLGVGELSSLAIDLVLKALPLDLTFVDAADKVRYYSDGGERIFPRSPAIIGREVRNCHPPASVDKVMAILEAFRGGERSREAFWIQRGDRFIHIEYRALRDPGGEYLGTLEISQDLTEKRALTGEKRLASF